MPPFATALASAWTTFCLSRLSSSDASSMTPSRLSPVARSSLQTEAGPGSRPFQPPLLFKDRTCPLHVGILAPGEVTGFWQTEEGDQAFSFLTSSVFTLNVFQREPRQSPPLRFHSLCLTRGSPPLGQGRQLPDCRRAPAVASLRGLGHHVRPEHVLLGCVNGGTAFVLRRGGHSAGGGEPGG